MNTIVKTEYPFLATNLHTPPLKIRTLRHYLKIENWYLKILAGSILGFGFFVIPASAHAADLYWIGAAGANTDVATPHSHALHCMRGKSSMLTACPAPSAADRCGDDNNAIIQNRLEYIHD